MTTLSIILLATAVCMLGAGIIYVARAVERIAQAHRDLDKRHRNHAELVSSLHRSLLDHHLYVKGIGRLVMLHERDMASLLKQAALKSNWPALSQRVALLELRLMPDTDDAGVLTRVADIETLVRAKGGTKEKA